MPNTLTPQWKPFVVPVTKVCNADYNRQIKMECWDYNRSGVHDYIGEHVTTLAALVRHELVPLELPVDADSRCISVQLDSVSTPLVISRDANGKAVVTLSNTKSRAKPPGGGCCGSRPAAAGWGRLILEEVCVSREPTFVEFLQGGCEISLAAVAMAAT